MELDTPPPPQGSYFSNNEAENKFSKQDSEGDHNVFSHEHLVAHSSSNNYASSTDSDPLLQSIFSLQTAQEVLEKELFKFKDISKDMSGDESISDLHSEFIEADQKLQQTSSGWLVYTGSASETVKKAKRYTEMEVEEVFKQKIETEVVYLVTSRMVQNLRIATVNHITMLEEQKAVAILRHAENKVAMLKKELKCGCDEIAAADETMELQKRVFVRGVCFLLQIVLLVVTVAVWFYRISPHFTEASAPT